MKSLFLLLLTTCWAFHSLAIHPDSTQAALRLLEQERETLRRDHSMMRAQKVGRIIELGLWKEAEEELGKERRLSREEQIVKAKLLFQLHRYAEAEQIITAVLKKTPGSQPARLVRAQLQVQAWTLPAAANTCLSLLRRNPTDEAAALLLGRIRMLEQKYPEALRWAKTIQKQNPANAEAFLLESDVHFWNQQPELAEAPLQRCLELAPFNADARFSYGYAIWRRVDATQLKEMAAQWELALEANPLHFVTHWHWGNGHTHLTYADYQRPDDEAVRTQLQKADQLVAQNKIQAAIALTREVEKQYPESVLPAMLRASVYYQSFDLDRRMRLDSAQRIFEQILQKKKHYGPAHNGLAAVIKQRQIPYLWAYDSLTAALRQTRITDSVYFARVFPDVNYYPGEMVQKMVWSQLYESVVYFPFLAKQNRQFVIPPLHIDLATAMKSPYFRQSTTFDNRQWMDIRGVGSGATALEYVVRGAYLERNVVLHEYVHLFHTIVFSDAENRRVRQLYYQAMQENRTLDYYSANNEHEYLAQTYPAYFEKVKVHPSDHKSINTVHMLKAKDPAMYAFLDSLVSKQRAYRQGNRQAMADNWAEVYVRLSEEVLNKKETGEKGWLQAAAYLDTALVWNDRYLPAYLRYASLKGRQQRFEEAGQWLQKARAIDSSYASIYVAEVHLLNERFRAGQISLAVAAPRQAVLYEKALYLENDYALRAEINEEARGMYARYARIPQAIRTAEDYVRTAPTVSTYLRDLRDEALAFAGYWRSITGAPSGAGAFGGSLTALGKLVRRKPQHFPFRSYYAQALMANGMYPQALQTLREAQRILEASGQPSADFTVLMAECRLATGDTLAARQEMQAVLTKQTSAPDQPFRLVRVLLDLGEWEKAQEEFKKIKPDQEPLAWSEYQYTLARIEGNPAAIIRFLEAALKANPYHLPARRELISQLEKAGKPKEAQALREGIRQLY
jgi:hypothetical protein